MSGDIPQTSLVPVRAGDFKHWIEEQMKQAKKNAPQKRQPHKLSAVEVAARLSADDLLDTYHAKMEENVEELLAIANKGHKNLTPEHFAVVLMGVGCAQIRRKKPNAVGLREIDVDAAWELFAKVIDRIRLTGYTPTRVDRRLR